MSLDNNDLMFLYRSQKDKSLLKELKKRLLIQLEWIEKELKENENNRTLVDDLFGEENEFLEDF